MTEIVGMLFEEVGQSAFGQSRGGSVSQLLHGVKIDVESGSLLAEGSSGDNFAPIGGEVADFLEKFGGKLSAWHGWYYLVLATRKRVQFLFPLYDTRLHRAKPWMASRLGAGNPNCRANRVPGIIVLLMPCGMGRRLSHEERDER